MDLGTMYSRLESRNYYSTAGQFLSDVRLMCENAMCYNPPDTIYYQKARKVGWIAEMSRCFRMLYTSPPIYNVS